MEQCTKGVKNEQRIVALERDMGEIKDAVSDMRDGLLSRPSWVITVIITILSGITMASLTFAFTILRMIPHG